MPSPQKKPSKWLFDTTGGRHERNYRVLSLDLYFTYVLKYFSFRPHPPCGSATVSANIGRQRRYIGSDACRRHGDSFSGCNRCDENTQAQPRLKSWRGPHIGWMSIPLIFLFRPFPRLPPLPHPRFAHSTPYLSFLLPFSSATMSL